jgi:hypothetical protein
MEAIAAMKHRTGAVAINCIANPQTFCLLCRDRRL